MVEIVIPVVPYLCDVVLLCIIYDFPEPTPSYQNAPDVRETWLQNVSFSFFCLQLWTPPDLSLTSGAETRSL